MILYFSGTGNSKYVADRVSEQLNAPSPISLNELVKKEKPEIFESGDPYVFCYPTYAWRMPRFLEAYLKKCSFKGDRRAYFLASCGDSVGASAEYAKKLCGEIGLEYMGLKAIVMPENYIAVFNCPSEEKCRDIVEKAKSVIDNAAAIIADRAVIEDKSGLKILSGIVNSVFYKFIVKAKPFHLEKECISCGLCVKSCVLNNIKLIESTAAQSEKTADKISAYKSADTDETTTESEKVSKIDGYSPSDKYKESDNTEDRTASSEPQDIGNTAGKATARKPVWGDNCTHCMACISICPVSAIEYGNKTQKKRRYRFKKINS